MIEEQFSRLDAGVESLQRARRNLAFKGIAELGRLLSTAAGSVCIRVLRTKVERLTIERAAAHALQRIRRIESKKRKKKPSQPDPCFRTTEICHRTLIASTSLPHSVVEGMEWSRQLRSRLVQALPG